MYGVKRLLAKNDELNTLPASLLYWDQVITRKTKNKTMAGKTKTKTKVVEV